MSSHLASFIYSVVSRARRSLVACATSVVVVRRPTWDIFLVRRFVEHLEPLRGRRQHTVRLVLAGAIELGYQRVRRSTADHEQALVRLDVVSVA